MKTSIKDKHLKELTLTFWRNCQKLTKAELVAFQTIIWQQYKEFFKLMSADGRLAMEETIAFLSKAINHKIP